MIKWLWEKIKQLWHQDWKNAVHLRHFFSLTGLLEFALLAALTIVVVVLVKAVFRPPVILIEEITIPETLQKAGDSARFLAHRIADERRQFRTSEKPPRLGARSS